MGDPKKRRKTYRTPSHPWRKERIDEENLLKNEYGTKNKKELYKLDTLLRKFKSEAKRLVTLHSEQAELEKKQFMEKIKKFNFLKESAELADTLDISVKDIMERRIQTLIVRKNLARTTKQARQFISHRHIMVNGKVITSPSKLLTLKEEQKLEFIPSSALASPSHPEREIKKAEETEEKPKKKPVKRRAPRKDTKSKDTKDTKPKKEAKKVKE